MTATYLDDVLVSGRTVEEHRSNLRQVLNRLRDAGLRLRKEKCSFMLPSVTYLGHTVDAEGIHPTQEKLLAVQNAPSPSNVGELRSYLGMLNYYHKFMPNLSTVLAPLHEQLHKEVQWKWERAQQLAFEETKRQLQSTDVLVHYDQNKTMLLNCGSSPYGVWAVLSNCMPDGHEKPIAFASRTLCTAEKNCSS